MIGTTALPALDTPEFRLVAGACAAAATGDALAAPPPHAIDPAMVAALVERHRLSAPVRRLLADALADPAPGIAAVLIAGARRERVLAFEQARQTTLLSGLLQARGIAHLVVKGSALSERLYGDLAARASKDIDLLVDPARLAEAGDAIAAAGFARTDGTGAAVGKHRTYAAGAIRIELHDRLIDLPAFAPLDFEPLWARRGTTTLLGRDLPVMSDSDTLLYLCAHGSEHAWFRLKWLQDIARIVSRDPGRIAPACHAAHRAGFDRVFVAMLRLVAELFGVHAPATAAGTAADARAIGRAVAFARAAIAAPAERAHAPTTRWIMRRALVQFGLRRDWRYRRDLLADLTMGRRSFDPARAAPWRLWHLPTRALRFWRSRRHPRGPHRT